MKSASIKPLPKRERQAKLRGFDRSLPMSLLRAREAVMKEFIPSLKEFGLTPQQWRVIRSLEQHGEQPLSTLAENCFLLMPSLSRIVQNLEAREFVRRKAVTGDQRSSMIVLSASGKELFKQIAPRSAERYERITERFGYGKLELLYELLEELVDRLDDEQELLDSQPG